MLLVAATQVGLDLIFLKFAQQLMADGYFKANWFLSITLAIIGVALSLLNVHWVNLAVKFYDQTDVIPIYMAFGMVTEMLCGLIIGDEFKLYNGA